MQVSIVPLCHTRIPLRHLLALYVSMHIPLRHLLTLYVSMHIPLRHLGIQVPESMRLPLNNTCTEDSIVLYLVRWLSPHPLRDSCLRLLCPPPFDINHALWTFTKRNRRRAYFSDQMFSRQIHLFPGSSEAEQRQSALDVAHARYGLVTSTHI